MDTAQIDTKLNALAKQPFRAKFHLSPRDLEIIVEKGLPMIHEHAVGIITSRVSPEKPRKDGKQTPYRGHPVFVAQHATATCCRNCLLRWHKIEKDKQMTPEEIQYAADVIYTWILRELARTDTIK